MLTIRPSQTTSVSIAAPWDVVWSFVSDPRQLPRWAPGFAREIEADGEHWVVRNDSGEVPIRVPVDSAAGTVEYLARGRELGSYTRLLRNGDGCEYLFTLFLNPDASPAAAEEQRAVIVGELETVRQICEAAVLNAP
jgi:Polyketide cyclase / dehydrase and lipid transport